jgi:hypothetical protein
MEAAVGWPIVIHALSGCAQGVKCSFNHFRRVFAVALQGIENGFVCVLK